MLKKFAGIVMGAIMTASVCAGAVAVAAVNRPVTQTEGDVVPAAAPAATAEVPTEYAAYLFAHFVGSEGNGGKDEQMYFSVSKNGTDWFTLNGAEPVLKVSKDSPAGTTGGVRDPSLIRLQDGSFVILATDLSIFNINGDWGASQTNGSRKIIIWKSNGKSLTDWGQPQAYEIAAPNTTNLWAPEAIWDKEQNAYMVFWASQTKDVEVQKVYRCYTTNFEEFTEPEVYIECEESRIDTTIFEENGVYYRFTKNEERGKKWVYMEKSDSLSGNFKLVSTFSINGHPYWEHEKSSTKPSEDEAFEGPTVFKRNDGKGYTLLLDEAVAYHYKAYYTDDISTGVFTSAGTTDFGGVTFRHGSCIPITQAEYDDLMNKWSGEAKDEESGTLIYSLDFDNSDLTAGGTQKDKTATEHATLSYTETGYNGTGKAVTFDKDTKSYISLDGSLLKDLDSFTVSFAAKIPNKDTNQDNPKGVNWLFLAEGEQTGTTNGSEHYLGILWQRGNKEIVAQRFKDGRPAVPSKVLSDYTFDTWKHITVVYGKTQTRLYIDGVLLRIVNSNIDISDLLGANPLVYLGYATWGSGEYAYASMDCFKLYNYALSSAQVQTAYNELNTPAE